MTDLPSWSSLDRKLVAILRGIRPDEAEGIVAALLEAGFRGIEVPLNSPEPFASIEIAVQTIARHGATGVLAGAGTVLNAVDARRVVEAGGNLIVAPNIEPEVVSVGRRAGIVTAPGVFTATEALKAVSAGASVLKFFPASQLGPGGINAIRAVLPAGMPICAVGGIGPADFAAYMKAGIDGFGLGSNLYKPGNTIAQVRANAEAAITAYDAAKNT